MMFNTEVTTPITADGVTVARGQFVWRALDYGLPSRVMVTRHLLAVWGWWNLQESVYADEQTALKAVLERAKDRLKKAKQDQRTATRTIEKIKERIR
jgi:hypothetical protein